MLNILLCGIVPGFCRSGHICYAYHYASGKDTFIYIYIIKHFLTFCKITVHLASLVPNKLLLLYLKSSIIIIIILAKFVLNRFVPN